MSTSVFVSGATGFIAQHIVKVLLSSNYKVVGSVRSASKGDHLAKLFNTDKFSYEIVEDVEAVGGFDQALKNHPEVTVFLHTASPFHFNVSDVEKELLNPAVNGTKNALNAIKAYGPQIKHVVVTSSYAAVLDLNKQSNNKTVFTEKSWNPITWEEAKENNMRGYIGSKTFAEKAAWDFVEREKPNFTINYINPTYVFGPQTFDSEIKDSLNTSSEVINSILKLNADSEIPAHSGGFTDVRDVARAHVVAFEKGYSNERFIMNTSKFASQDILDIINSEFSELKGKLPVGTPGTGHETTDKTATIDNTKTKELLGFQLTDLKTTVVDSVAQILKARK